MLVLAIDTSGEICSMGISSGETPIVSKRWSKETSSSKSIGEFAASLLKEKGLRVEEIDMFAVASGPGFYTGLRVGLAFAKGLAWALDKPLFAVNTLEALANRAFSSRYVAPVLDAKKEQVFCALFEIENELLKRVEPDKAMKPRQWAKFLKEKYDSKIFFIGSGASLYRKVWESLDAVVAPDEMCYDLWEEVAKIGIKLFKQGIRSSASDVQANYIRFSETKPQKGRL